MKSFKSLLGAAVVLAMSSLSYGTVYFQNAGDNTGWGNYPQNPEAQGVIENVIAPTYHSNTSIHFTQTFVSGYTGRYHSEVDEEGIQQTGQDRYYGLAVYLPANWVNATDQVNIQQWAGTGPWIIMRVDGPDLLMVFDTTPDFSGEPHLQAMPHGVWTRVVTRINSLASGGAFTVWVNGTQKITESGNLVAPGNGGAIRWSAGCYVSGWFQRTSPQGPSFRETYESNYRVASSQSSADPVGWYTFTGQYKLVDRNSGKSVVVQGASTANSAPCILYTYNGSGNDEWSFVLQADGHYEIKNLHSGLAMVVQSASTSSGAAVIQYAFGGSNTNDEWDIVDLGGTGYFKIVNVNSGLALDVKGAGTANSTPIDQASYTGANNQQFQIVHTQ